MNCATSSADTAPATRPPRALAHLVDEHPDAQRQQRVGVGAARPFEQTVEHDQVDDEVARLVHRLGAQRAGDGPVLVVALVELDDGDHAPGVGGFARARAGVKRDRA